MPKPILLPLDQLDLANKAQKRLQVRESENPETIARYAEIYRERGAEALPAIRVVRDTDTGCHWLTDGWHRAKAARKAGLEAIPAVIDQGDVRDATLAALGANGDHGLPLTLAERTANATALLQDGQWRKWSDARIAKHVHISPQLVAKLRRKVPGAQVETRERADGTTVRPTNSRAKAAAKAKAEPAIRLEVGAATVPAIDMLDIALREQPELAKLAQPKRYILAALWLAGKPLDRDTLSALLNHPVDVHPGQLRRAGLLEETNGCGYMLSEEACELLRGLPWETQDGRHWITDEPGELGQEIWPDGKPGANDQADEPETLGPADVTPAAEKPAPAKPTAQPAPAPAARPGAKSERQLLADAIERKPIVTTECAFREWALLVLIVGIDTHPAIRWGDEGLATAKAALGEIFARNLADAIRAGNPRLPDTATLARLFGIDPEVLRIQAEGAKP